MTKPQDPADVLVREHRQFLSFLRKRVRGEAEAEEVLQAAYAKGLRKQGSIKDGESTVAWFYRLLRNALIDHWRHRAVETKALERYGRELEDAGRRADAALEKAVCQCVKKLVKTVKPEYGEILQKVDVEEMSLQDYARRSGLTANTAAVRAHRARKSLKKRLIEACGTCAEHGCLDCRCKP